MSLTRKCRWSGQDFTITDEDLAFYEKIGVPPPTLAPKERERRRQVWRNEHHLYKRDCGLCSKTLISIYPKECSFPVYCDKCFWSDKWNPLDYGQEIDWSRPFFEQMSDLQNATPRLAISHANCINSEYALNCINNKNCYLTSGADHNEDCMYGINSQRSKDCVDHYLIYDSELCHSCLDSSQLYNCVSCQNCESCSDAWFLYDSKSCKNCAFSSNLRNKQYVFENQQLTKDEYETRLASKLAEIFKDPNWASSNLTAVRENAIHRHALIISSENVSGNNIRNSKNAHTVFDVEDLEDCKFVNYALDTKDSMDITAIGFKSSLLYESISGGAGLYNCIGINFTLNGSNLFYCIGCQNSNDLFGCVSCKNHNELCILNKQYSREEYKKLVAQLIKHMKGTGEWGEFFPMKMSPYEYNRSMAADYLPLTREEALTRGAKWHKAENTVAQNSSDPSVHTCTGCSKNYRPIAQELSFYKCMELPVPEFCWPCRLLKLIAARAPQELHEHTCTNCNAQIETTVHPDSPAKVFCEKCYLNAVY